MIIEILNLFVMFHIAGMCGEIYALSKEFKE